MILQNCTQNHSPETSCDTAFKCYPPVPNALKHSMHALIRLVSENRELCHQLSEEQKNASARTLPLLLCAEQSAVHFFHNENERLIKSEKNSFLEQLQAIEADESIHAQILETVLNHLPRPADLTRIKRRSQLFYCEIVRQADSISDHFRIIHDLDTCACIILMASINSSIKNTLLSDILEVIKNDEARHISITKKYFKFLNSKSFTPQEKEFHIHEKLIKILDYEKESYEILGVDYNNMTRRILHLASKKN